MHGRRVIKHLLNSVIIIGTFKFKSIVLSKWGAPDLVS